MSTPFNSKERFVIPRFIPSTQFRLAFYPNLGNSNHFSDQITQNEFTRLEYEWVKNKNLNSGIELLSVSNISKYKSVYIEDVKSYLRKFKNEDLKGLNDVISILLKTNTYESIEDYIEIIKALKLKLRINYDDPFVHHDLAYYYLVLGQKNKSKKHIEISRNLAKTNFLINRSYSSSLLSIEDDPERALYYLRNLAGINNDPGLIATEIGISKSNGLVPKFLLNGQKLLNNNKLSWGMAELFSNIATINLMNGNTKQSKKYFKRSLENPNENIIAQIYNLKNKGLISFEENSIIDEVRVPLEFEADALKLYRKSNYRETLSKIDEWILFQPFSTNPRILKSYVLASVLGNHKEAINVLKSGLIYDQNNFTLLNNYAYSLLHIGEYDKAEALIQKLSRDSISLRDKAVLSATTGLLKYRSGQVESGRILYLSAESYFIKHQDQYHALLARLCHLNERLRIKDKSALQDFLNVKSQVINSGYPDLEFIFNRIENEHETSRFK